MPVMRKVGLWLVVLAFACHPFASAAEGGGGLMEKLAQVGAICRLQEEMSTGLPPTNWRLARGAEYTESDKKATSQWVVFEV